MSAIGLLAVLALWALALFIARFHNRPEALSERLPLISRYRDPKSRPLFRSSADVLWLAFWPFALGLILLTVFLIQR